MTGNVILAPVDVAIAYFDRLDRGAPDLLELFADGFEFYFPKFGIGKGRDDFVACLTGLQSQVERLTHYIDRTTVIEAGDKVVVEGISSGRLRSGKEWHGGMTAGGRFCNVFEIRGGLIERVSIYLDPDYVSEDTDRFLWKDRKSRW
ncbi:nuclear transport factor 2 family protein [Paraburkholderia pallida]|uniref:Nuclear transport factor 2 family protein n=1 Tax=Paraburkholderia pallida TaxID=2547399 RepID=A0A4P7D174_9BURK|nr:nuclear transport factor 2 family protein [Paraburkholderia pallida]QBR01578.1 nuclear transport factor 2 family protein [Paraburkholderia pallida]